ncbi:MAG: amidinotransferase [Reichenbachiella sp.]
MDNELTQTLLMIKPVHFRHNDQTAVNNYYQKNDIDPEEAQTKAEEEFNSFVSLLRTNGVEVIVILDNDDHDTPDSIFPNNWVSFHSPNIVGIYPMYAENRRLERREDIFEYLQLQGFSYKERKDFTTWEGDNKYLEGTGSLVLDRENKIAYAAISERTHIEVLEDFEEKLGYTSIRFSANQSKDQKRLPIYHTNVMMSMGDTYAIICLDSIDDELEKNEVILSLSSTGKEIVEISEEQVSKFAGNALQVTNNKNERILVMSEQAKESLSEDQISELLKYNDHIISSSLNTIETLGGGSARCMMAEVFLEKN